jgi:hypothetical protein
MDASCNYRNYGNSSGIDDKAGEQYREATQPQPFGCDALKQQINYCV